MKTFDPSNNQIVVESVDPSLIDVEVPIDTYPYKIHGEFATYPKNTFSTVTTADAVGVISFGNQCLEPTFSATSQTDITPNDRYSGNNLVFTLNPFSISPANCKINYSCVSVVGAVTDDTPIVTPACDEFTDNLNNSASPTLTRSFDIDDYRLPNGDIQVRPQEYTVMIKGTAEKSG